MILENCLLSSLRLISANEGISSGIIKENCVWSVVAYLRSVGKSEKN